jgi:hypothetical protein
MRREIQNPQMFETDPGPSPFYFKCAHLRFGACRIQFGGVRNQMLPAILKELFFEGVHLVAPALDNLIQIVVFVNRRLSNDFYGIQLPFVIARSILKLIQQGEHFIVNIVNFTLDMFSNARTVQ